MSAAVEAGHNKPPALLDLAREAFQRLSNFLQEHPVLESAADSQAAFEIRRSTELTLKDLEAERKQQVAPLKQRTDAIDAGYRAVRKPLEQTLTVLKERLTLYARAEEDKRQAAADAAAAVVAAAEAAARAAEAAEQEAIANAAAGECTDVGAAMANADQAFADYAKANRQAAVAERDVTVRFRSQLGGPARAMTDRKVLVVTDAAAALTAIGLTEKIREAILVSARDYRRAFGELPAGVREDIVRGF